MFKFKEEVKIKSNTWIFKTHLKVKYKIGKIKFNLIVLQFLKNFF